VAATAVNLPETPQEQLRRLAASVWSTSDHNIKEAVRQMQVGCKNQGLKMPGAPEKFIRRWGKRYEATKSTATNSSNAGRKPTLTEEQVVELLECLLAWKKEGRRFPWSSIKKFMTGHPRVKEIVAATNASVKAVTRALKRWLPSLGRARIEVRPKLTPKQKHARVMACKRLLRLPFRKFQDTVWIDAKVLYVNLKFRHGWIDTADTPGQDLVQESVMSKSKHAKMIKLKYYAAVNADVGPVAIVFTTGTTGMPATRRDPPYMVITQEQRWVAQHWGHHVPPS
jgi:transposase